MNSVPPAASSSTPGRRAAAPRARTGAPRRRRRAGCRRSAARTAARRAARARAGSARTPRGPSRARRSAAPAKGWSAICCSSARSCCIRRLLPIGTASGEPSSLPDWRWRRPASSARSTVRSSFASDSGFSTKSKAPRRVASTAVSTVPWPDIMTTGQPSVAAADHSRSSVMPSMSGIQMSSSTRSGTCRAREARACAALAATSTS